MTMTRKYRTGAFRRSEVRGAGRRAPGALASALLGVATFTAIGASCSVPSETAPLPYCETTREYFITHVWEPVLSRKCVACHTAQGAARESRLVLAPPTAPGFVDINLATIIDVASYNIRGEEALLLKPSAQIEHGGGLQIAQDSDEYSALSELIRRTQGGEPEGCAPIPTADRFPGVELRSLSATLYKASLRIAGRLPTMDEMASVDAGGEEAFNNVLGSMMAEPGFLDAVKVMFQDASLFAPTTPSEQDYPKILSYSGEQLHDVMRDIGREPLELIARLVREGRPLTEILTADSTVVSPITAPVYGVADQVSFEDPQDPDDFKEAKLSIHKAGAEVPIPHAGVLTTSSFLRAYSGGSRQRRRADAALRLFLGTDTSLLARDGVDVTWRATDFNPTLNDDRCTPCHGELDRLAGAFLSWTPGASYAPPLSGWYSDMPPPGFGGQEVPNDELDRGHQIVAQAIAESPRFGWAIARIVYRSLIGREPLAYPMDREDPSYPARLMAWIAQDTFFKSAVDDFVAEGYRIEALVRHVVKSPYFRAASAAPPEPGREAEIQELGTMRLLPPDLLDKKLVALTGITKWTSRIASEYHYYYALGASGTRYAIEEREERASGLMAAITERIAHEIACFAVAVDFSREPSERLLFPHVGAGDAPRTEASAEDAEKAAAIRENIRFLHARLFGDSVPASDPEIKRAYSLFEDTWKEGTKAIAAGDQGKNLPWACRTENVDASIPLDRQISEDPRYIIRAWMAVIKAMLSDPGFLYEH